MKIILVDDDAYHYMDMRDDIMEYKKRIVELSDAISSNNQKIIELSLQLAQLRNESKEPVPPTTHDYPSDTTREEHTSTRWSMEDITLLKNRIFMTGTYFGTDRSIDTIHALFKSRTRAAVTAMIYQLGGTVKKGIVQPRLHPKQKGEI